MKRSIFLAALVLGCGNDDPPPYVDPFIGRAFAGVRIEPAKPIEIDLLGMMARALDIDMPGDCIVTTDLAPTPAWVNRQRERCSATQGVSVYAGGLAPFSCWKTVCNPWCHEGERIFEIRFE